MAESKIGYTSQEMEKWQGEAAAYDKIAQESADMAAVRQKLAQRSTAPSELAAAYEQLQQGQLQKQAMRAAYARGYNPAAQRMAMEGVAEAQLDIASKVQSIQHQEQDRAAMAYGQLLQNKQKMALAAEEAKKAFIMGNQKIALQRLDDARRAEISAKGVQMAEAQAKADANAKFTSALIGAAGAITSYGAQSGWFNAAPTAPQATSVLSPNAQAGLSRAVPSLYESGGLFDTGAPQTAYQGPYEKPLMLAAK